ncbi:glycoside hydrolase family 3 C-terminal domain-containing protein [Eisenbergiella massiliensis]|uniref:glycoside hydrolase family 3 C-terminal domain-containing protein n=1 Tax=Eisenbergiella massiliensis TaxID=1720294 RepID=UPI0039916D40
MLYGSWSFFGDEQDCVTVKAGVTQNYPDADVFFAQGCPTADPGTNVLGFQKTPPKEEFDLQEALDTAVELAKKADKVVLTLGEHRDFSGEGASRADITLPSCQLELFHKICEVNPNVCVVLFNGRPLDIREINQKAKAILEAWLPGTEGGNALARILYGDASPSGRLSMSFPYCVGQVPVHYNHMSTGRPFAGDYRTTRYNSKYLDIPNEPLYPFGYGLTYTAFEYSDISLDSDILHKGDSICASVRVTNTGERPGTETVQMYLHDVSASVTRPVRELKGFCKVFLEPGESRVIAFPITEDMLRFYNITMDYVSEPGQFEVFIGSDSTTSRKAVFSLC